MVASLHCERMCHVLQNYDRQKYWHDVIDGMTEYRGYFAHYTEGRETTITITIPEDISPSIFFRHAHERPGAYH